ncbi:transcription initiation factor TFIID subunit 4b-like [Syzygium oleosum]|uniref:transcription initiation factor TFIID subunit 4b-like n=1 Tax=Syzygium oleosum TaxID=219896 RepID=UPI0011D2AA08|nr:transcription initiation factor TFIID subunit 4b-like [Syzygium oleosum]XP_056166602.1 transcription initiation factor TFIID subunit 4b-like [Syzygium oleosum]XP_056166603.1 transcription initiation factor TFIID subunit 4b-like [Syzygium oleosum]
MDPSIVKLLEEDEDESMHSGADVEAFQAALNRDIGGVSQGDNHMPSQSYTGWQPTSQAENANSQIQQEQKNAEHQEQMLAQMQRQQGDSLADPQQNSTLDEVNHQHLKQKQVQDGHQLGQGEQNALQIKQSPGMPVSDSNSLPMSEPGRVNTLDSESQYLKLQQISNQQATVPGQAPNKPNRVKQVPFALLLPVILPQLDKDRAMQLQTLYAKLKKNDIPKEGFVRIMRGIVGDQMLKMAVMKMQTQPPPQLHIQGQTSALLQHSRMQPASAAKFNDSSPSGQVHSTMDRNGPKAGEVPDSQFMQQQHFQNMQTFPKYGSPGGYHPFSGTNMTSSTSSVKTQPNDTQMKQITIHQNLGSSHPVGSTQAMSLATAPKFDRQHPSNDNKRVQSGSLPPYAGNITLQQNSVPWKPSTTKDQSSGAFSSSVYVKHEPVDQSSDQQKQQLSSLQGLSSVSAGHLEQRIPISGTSRDSSFDPQSPGVGFLTPTSTGTSHQDSLSATPVQDTNVQLGARAASTPAGNNARTPSKKPSVGQKKPLETLGSSPPPSSKKQKTSGSFADQSIEQLIDVTAVSGVNLREEEEQLFSGPKEDGRVSEASRRVVQEEEEALILQRAPLQKKLAEIMARCGVKNISNDVERCLSLCVEERLRGLLCNLIRVSKQRVDVERPRHRTIVTSDVRQHLMILNRKAREEWEKKQAEAEKLRKQSEPDSNQGVDGDKEKDENRGKSVKVNKEEDDKMRTTAANVAARAAVGGDDMLSKWQLMAEQARQKREGGLEVASQVGKDSQKSSISGRSNKDNQEAGKKGQAASGAIRKLGRNQAFASQLKIARTISVKDVIAVLEREPQMSKSSLIYRLYDKVGSERSGE